MDCSRPWFTPSGEFPRIPARGGLWRFLFLVGKILVLPKPHEIAPLSADGVELGLSFLVHACGVIGLQDRGKSSGPIGRIDGRLTLGQVPGAGAELFCEELLFL